MKTLLGLLITIISFNSISDKSNNSTAIRSWWKTVIVDAAGALGGAGSVASIGSVGVCSNPVGWTAIGIGAVIGGAGASLAKVAPANTALPIEKLNLNYSSTSNISNSSNSNDDVGKQHNEIIIGFAKSKLTFNTKNYIDYIKSLNNKEYNNCLKNTIDKEYLEGEFSSARKVLTEDDAINLVINRAPNVLDKKMLRVDLEELLQSQDLTEFLFLTNKMENKYSRLKNIQACSKVSLNTFFSTLRYSASLWVK